MIMKAYNTYQCIDARVGEKFQCAGSKGGGSKNVVCAF